MEINPKTGEFYKNRLKLEGSSAVRVGWKNEEAQMIRFEQLAKVILPKLQEVVVNDFGCGLGDLYSYLLSLNFPLRYRGYDNLDESVLQARKNFGEDHDRRFTWVRSAHEMEDADYTLVSGTFNVKEDTSEDHWRDHVTQLLRVIDGKSSKGFSFNLLTSYSDKDLMQPELYYADPGWMFDFCKRNFSKNVALLHDYGIYDFTILVRKDI